ncbi:beta-ketoacyl-ACP reductase [Natronoarchaeum sp. GCM10025703]|uniref:beta-ketoacyl-ACP reductase n=1 Tax=unclassified Natronoarchaeum TaxID=2620183 RepID=UPI003616B229
MDDRTCLITGASRGIGSGIAEDLAAEGANVIINYRSSTDKANDVVEKIRSAGGTAMTAQADVTGRMEVEAMREAIHEEFGPVDVLVNNAGITQDTRFEEMSREEWDRVIDVNLGGVFNVTQVFFDDIKTADEGRLINISSIVGKQGNFGQANYATAKSGLFGFTRTIALELARSGSTANSVCPGFTQTDMLAEVDDRIQEQILEDIPLDRFARIEDIAATVRFLASEDSSYITGEVIDVNGGMDL